MKYAKAYAGAAAVVLTFLVGEVGLELPEEVTASIATLLVPLVVAIIPNKEASSGSRPGDSPSGSTPSSTHHFPSP